MPVRKLRCRDKASPLFTYGKWQPESDPGLFFSHILFQSKNKCFLLQEDTVFFVTKYSCYVFSLSHSNLILITEEMAIWHDGK